MKKITGIHHVALRPTKENYERTLKFYTEILGFELTTSWGSEDEPCCMLSIDGRSYIELLGGGASDTLGEGAHSHLAFQTEHVDELTEAVRKAGYEITIEPKDVVLKGNPEIPARIAFCKGPVSETVEFFHVK